MGIDLSRVGVASNGAGRLFIDAGARGTKPGTSKTGFESAGSSLGYALRDCPIAPPSEVDVFRLCYRLFLCALACVACQVTPKSRPHPSPRTPWTVKLERVRHDGKRSSIRQCAIDGKACHEVSEGTAVALPARLETGDGARATLRLDASTTLTLDENAVVTLPDVAERTVALERGTLALEQTSNAMTEIVAANHPIRVERPGRLALRARDSARAAATVHRGEATVFGDTEARVLHQGQTFALARGKAMDDHAVFAGRVLPVPWLRWDRATEPATEPGPRGFGRVTARVPGTQQVVSGVRLTKHLVRAVIKDGFARTEVEEEIFNDSSRVLEGRYVFALPSGASLSRLALWVGSELVEGEIVERDRGARIFRGIADDSVRPRDPALLEWVGGSELSLKIFPIEPRRGRRVVLAYNEALPTEGGTMRYRYPLGLGRERTTTIDEFSLTVTAYDSRGELHAMSTPGYATRNTEHPGGVTTEFVAQAFAPSRDFVVEYAVPDGSAPVGLFVPDWGNAERELPEVADGDKDASYIALRLTAELPEGTPLPDANPRDRVVVVDRSFSQGKESLDAQLQSARALLEDLGTEERFAVLACDAACDAYPRQGLEAASLENVGKGEAWLASLGAPRGASDLAGAVVAATKRLEADGGGQVVVLGDGRATAGEMGANAIAERIRPFVTSRHVDLRFLGVGGSVDEVLLSGLASAVGATYERVASTGSLADGIDPLVLSLRSPVVATPSIEAPEEYVEVHPRRLPNLRLGQTVLFTAKLRDAARGSLTALASVTLRGTLAGKPYRFERKLGPAERARQNPLIPRLWAEQAITELESQGSEALAGEIVGLSRRHHVLSRRTSLLVLENEQMFAEFGVRRTQVPSSRRQEVMVQHDLWDDEFGDTIGSGGLGLQGIGNGGGGQGGDRIGLGSIGTYGRAAGGLAGGQGYGQGRLGGSHRAHAPSLRMGASAVNGRIPPEIIQRSIRQRYGVFRACYEQGLSRNPKLAGRVSLRFVIGRDGRVMSASGSGSDLPDPATVECMVRATYGMSFPAPEGGIVTVVYPILLDSDRATGSTPTRRTQEQLARGYVPADPIGEFWRPIVHRIGTEKWRERGESEVTRVKQAVQRHPESRRAWSNLLGTLLRLGRFDDAYREGQELARRDPDDASTHERLAWAAAARGDGVEAASELGTAAELGPSRAAVQLAAARAFEAVGDEARACAHWRAAASIQVKPGRARFESLRCRARLGELTSVRKELATAANDSTLDPLRTALDSDRTPAYSSLADASGWFEARLECSTPSQKCPVAAIVTPQGRVASPWTPELARASASHVALTRTGTGRYRTLLVGGEPGARGKLTLVVNGKAYVQRFTHPGGVVTAVETDVNG